MKKTAEGYPACELSRKGLKVETLSKKYRRFQLKDISFEIPPGSILGLLGRNGAGKTTAIKLLTGHTKKSGGTIWVNGSDMEKGLVPAQSQIGFVLDEPMFLETKSLWENGNIFGRFYPGFSQERWKEWLSICNLPKSDWLGMLSKGQRVKFQFAFAMAHRPRILLLDEPTGNLDPVFRKEFLDILQEVVEKEQISVLFSSHLTSDLEKVADQIALLEQGALLYTGSMEELLSRYCLIKGDPKEGRKLKTEKPSGMIGIQVNNVGFEAMIDREKLLQNQKDGTQGSFGAGLDGLGLSEDEILREEIDLSKWMYYMTKGGGCCES